MSPSQATCVRAAIDGDPGAFNELVARHSAMVCAITLAMTGARQASEDAAQEALLAAWHSLPSLQDPERFTPWLRQLTKNRTKQFLRSRSRRLARVAPDSDTVASARSDERSAPEDLLAAEQEAALAAAIDQLPESSREVVVLYYREGQSVAEVARALDLSEAAVRKRLSRARAALHDDLDERVAPLLVITAPGPAFRSQVQRMVEPRPAPVGSKGGKLGWAAGGAVAGSVLTAVVLLWSQSEPEVDAPVAPPTAQAAPSDVGDPSPLPPPVRLLRPSDEPRNDEVGDVPDVQTVLYADLPSFQKVQQSQIRNAFWRVAYEGCFAPGLDHDGPVDVVVVTTVDPAGLKALDFQYIDEVPDDVVDCLDDLAWTLPWPGVDGELQQRGTYTIDEPPEPVSWEEGRTRAQQQLTIAAALMEQLEEQRESIEAAMDDSEEDPEAEVVVFEGGAK